MDRARMRIATLTIGVIGAALVLAGCSSDGSPSAASGSATSTSQSDADSTGSTTESQSPGGAPSAAPATTEAPTVAPAGPGRCTAANLTATVQPADSAAGNRYANLVVTNAGSATCTLYGYGGLQLLAADGRALPTQGKRDEPPMPTLVSLAPGASAAKLLHWTVIPSGGESEGAACEPTAAKLSVIPPDETQPFTVAWDLGQVCAAGTFHDSAFHKK